MRDEATGLAEGDDHAAVRQQGAAVRVQFGVGQRGQAVGIERLAVAMLQLRAKFGFVRSDHIAERPQRLADPRIGRRRIEQGQRAGLARERERRGGRFERGFQLGQDHGRLAQRGALRLDEPRRQLCIRARSDHDAVAAVGVDVDAGGAGRRVAGQGAQVDAVGLRERARQLAAGIVAESADETGAGAGAGRGGGLVEALAAGTGAVLAGQGLARARQRRQGPDMIDIERADDDHPAGMRSAHRLRRRSGSARPRWSRS